MKAGKIKKIQSRMISGPRTTHDHLHRVAGKSRIAFQLPVSMRCVITQPNDGPNVAMHVRTGSDGFMESSFNPSAPRTRGAQMSHAHPIAIP